MDLPPVIGDMANSQIANYSQLANNKLKEAQGLLQSALDTHMLLSHYDFYKQFSNNVGETLDGMKNDLTNGLLSQSSGDSLNPYELWDYAQGKYKEAVSAYEKIKNVKAGAQEKFQQGKSYVQDMAKQAKKNTDDIIDDVTTKTNKAVVKVGNKVKEVEMEARGKVKQGETLIKDESNKIIGKTKETFDDTAQDIKANLKPASDFFEDPSLMRQQIFTEEELAGETMKTPFLNQYYASKLTGGGDGFPDDIFADTEGPKIKTYSETYAKSARKVKKIKTKNPKEEQAKVSEEPNLKPSEAIKKLEAQKVKMSPERALPKAEEEEPKPAQEPTPAPQRVEPNFDDVETSDLQKEYDGLQNAARSEGAEQRFQDIGQELTNRTIQGLDRPVNTEPTIDTLDTVENEAQKLAQAGTETLQRPLTVVQGMTQQAIEEAQSNVVQGFRNFSNLAESTTNNLSDAVNNVQTQIKSGVADGIQKAKQALGLDTEESLGGDEDPVGLAVTAVLGLADIGTQIASFFDPTPKIIQPSTPSQQIGV